MVDLQSFASKHLEHARRRGVGAASVSAACEVGWWLANQTGVSIRSESSIWDRGDWDICIVLDAARHDLFAEAAVKFDWLPPEPGMIWSVGSMSPEWIGKTFRPTWYPDWQTVGYVTANPFSGKDCDRSPGAPAESLPLESPPMAFLDEVWRDQWTAGPVSTVNPEEMAERTLFAWHHRDGYEIDQVVSHFMQPHIPFRSRPDWFGERESVDYFGEPNKEKGGKDIWLRVRDGEVGVDEVWKSYRDNLQWALEAVNQIRHRTSPDTTIAITSDHGNGLGERGIWGHPPNIGAPAVRQVPWVTITGTGQRVDDEIDPQGDPPATRSADEDIEERLSALGYR